MSYSGVADLLGEVSLVRVPDERWECIDGEQVQLNQVDRVLAVDARVEVQKATLGSSVPVAEPGGY
jgi:hypothetical protein